VYCGQTVAWIKMPLGTEEGLGPGDNVLDGDSALPRKGAHQPPHFLAHVYCGQTVSPISATAELLSNIVHGCYDRTPVVGGATVLRTLPDPFHGS